MSLYAPAHRAGKRRVIRAIGRIVDRIGRRTFVGIVQRPLEAIPVPSHELGFAKVSCTVTE